MRYHYKVTFEFRNDLGKWVPDYLEQNMPTMKDAFDIARQLKETDNIRYVEVVAVRNW